MATPHGAFSSPCVATRADRIAVHNELIDNSETFAGHLVMRRGVLLRQGHEEPATDGLYAERSVARRQCRVDECVGPALKREGPVAIRAERRIRKVGYDQQPMADRRS